ncbi:hypothetical protein MLD38_038161 [Melastoma candidum]|uniref:Uncharacterized protein n=1 Tax=Melastoma candidum TaxID=119954 RepID=A0ACB9L0C2_9MYRT|nr:hypothetical protein MLD38_038161 [Melastoma candidum]
MDCAASFASSSSSAAGAFGVIPFSATGAHRWGSGNHLFPSNRPLQAPTASFSTKGLAFKATLKDRSVSVDKVGGVG